MPTCAENLTPEEQQKLAGLLAGPVGGELRVARTFLEHWFAIWADDLGNRRTPQEAERRYEIWHTNAETAKIGPLRRQQQHLDGDHFVPSQRLPSESGLGTNQQCR